MDALTRQLLVCSKAVLFSGFERLPRALISA